MFNHYIGSLPVGREFTGLSIRDPYNMFPELELVDKEHNPERALADYLTVEEVCYKQCPKTVYAPGFVIRGEYVNGNQFNQIFRIDPFGQDLLCFTGKPEGDNNTKFRLKNTIYRYYWEDKIVGYITQIIKATPENVNEYYHNDY